MTLRRILQLASLFTAVALAARATAQVEARSLQQRTVLTDADAYAVLPPELIAAPEVTMVLPSPDLHYLLVERLSVHLSPEFLRGTMAGEHKEPHGEITLILWDAKSRVAREVWHAPLPTHPRSAQWLPGSNVALVLVDEIVPPDPSKPDAGPQTRAGLLRISPASEKAEVVGATEFGSMDALNLDVAPDRPAAILRDVRYETPREVRQPDGQITHEMTVQTTLHVLQENGRLGARVPLPEGSSVSEVRWSADGAPVLQVFHRDRDPKKVAKQWFAMNPLTAALTPVDSPPPMPLPRTAVGQAPTGRLRLRPSAMPAKEEGTTQNIGLLWLESSVKSDKPRVLVAGDARNGQLLSDEVVLYQSQGAMWAAPLLHMTREEYAAMAAAAERVELINRGKQVALAALMYTADHDETMPTGDNITGKLSPYLNMDSMFEGLNYTYSGGPLKDINNPSETEMGFFSGAGGRAIMYIDGHVKWKPDK